MKRKLTGDNNGVKLKPNAAEQSDCDDDLEVKISKHRGVPQGLITCARKSCSYLSFLLIEISILTTAKDGLPPTEWKGIMDIIHVFVPEASRGLKVAEQFARKAFSVAAENNLAVRATCTYIRDTFLIRCPEYVGQILHVEVQDKTCLCDNVIAAMSVDSNKNIKLAKKLTTTHGA